MAYLSDAPFPDAVARGATGGPGFLTDVVALGSGGEQRNIRWSQARAKYNISTGVRTRAQMADVIAHFRNVFGRGHSFPFKDWTDFDSGGDNATVQLTSTTFQIVKNYAVGANTFVRTILRPVNGTVVVKVSGSIVTPASIDYLTGIITFASAPSATPTAAFQFNVPVRYDIDQLPVQANSYDNQIVTQIDLIEVTDE
ncbi:MAG TPA: DUF2460 domain-containing protein [Rhizomicrobium sp.]|jgi:uncharacterized protein (TIGR02217 family)